MGELLNKVIFKQEKWRHEINIKCILKIKENIDTAKEGRRVYQPKYCVKNIKEEQNS